MSLTKEITDKKVNFEFNKEFINIFNKKIKDNNTEFLDLYISIVNGKLETKVFDKRRNFPFKVIIIFLI